MSLFPEIRHIDDVLPHIDDTSFRVIKKDCGHTYINYTQMGKHTFPSLYVDCSDDELMNGPDISSDEWDLRAIVRRECRGIAFHTDTGLIVSRPFHKFFNVGERDDMTHYELDFRRPHIVMDKVDGSMIRPIPTVGGLRWGTKMGITDTAMLAETWLVNNSQYASLAHHCIAQDLTPLFEYVSPENRVVVDYGERNMTLLAVRNVVTGEYLAQTLLNDLGARFGIPVVKVYDPVEGDPTIYIDAVRGSDELDEGIVVAFPDGQRAKVKTDTYSILHKVKEAGRTERTMVTAILDGKIDDLLPMLPEDAAKRVLDYVSRFYTAVERLSKDIDFIWAQSLEDFSTKKDLAIGTKDSHTQLERGALFALWDQKVEGPYTYAMQIVTNALSSETKWEEMKQNVAMATNFQDFTTHWNLVGGDEYA